MPSGLIMPGSSDRRGWYKIAREVSSVIPKCIEFTLGRTGSMR
jgi:hypothetical protein